MAAFNQQISIMSTPNYEISRRLSPTAVYKLQTMARDLHIKAKKQKKGFDLKDAAHRLAERFRLPLEKVQVIIGAKRNPALRRRRLAAA